MRSLHTATKSSPHSPQLEKAQAQQRRSNAAKNKINFKKIILKKPDNWFKKMWYIYTMEYYSAIKENEIMPFAATWMDLEIIILSELNQTKTII